MLLEELDDVLPQEAPKAQKKEVEMAQKLIDSLTADFDPSQYRDEYREELLSMIERKAEGKELVTAANEEPEPTKAPDLMAALEQSIAAVRGSDLGKGGAKRKPAAKKPSTKSKAKASSRSKSSSKSGSNSSKGGSRSKSSRSKSKSKSS